MYTFKIEVDYDIAQSFLFVWFGFMAYQPLYVI